MDKKRLLEVIDEKLDTIVTQHLGNDAPDRVRKEYFYLKNLYRETVVQICQESNVA